MHGGDAHPPLPTAFGVNSAVKTACCHRQDTAAISGNALGRTDRSMKTLFAIAAALAVLHRGPWPVCRTHRRLLPYPRRRRSPPPPRRRKSPSSTVSGVTVQALSRKPCAPKDKDCVALGMAQVKVSIRKQLEAVLFPRKHGRHEGRTCRPTSPAGATARLLAGGEQLCHRHVSPVVKQVCAGRTSRRLRTTLKR